VGEVGSNIRFVRSVRTPSSEKYTLTDGDEEVLGVLDLHFSATTSGEYIHGSLVMLSDLQEEDEQRVVELINEEIVESYAPDWARAEFVLEVYTGKRVSTYSDAELTDEDDDDFDDDEEF